MRQNNYSNTFMFPSTLPNHQHFSPLISCSSLPSTLSASQSNAAAPSDSRADASCASSPTVVGPHRTDNRCSFALDGESQVFSVFDVNFIQEQANVASKLIQAKELALQLKRQFSFPVYK